MFLTTNELQARLKENICFSQQVDIASAWATRGPALYALITACNTKRVKIRAMIGTFGNATDPDALEGLRDIGDVCLGDGSEAMFHPKIYIFRRGKESRAWVGSANFTRAGFGRNIEVCARNPRCEGHFEVVRKGMEISWWPVA